MQKLYKTRRKMRQKISRANKKISQLQLDINEAQNKINEISEIDLSKLIEDSKIPKCQSSLLHEIFAAAKYKNAKSRRYSESWIILCLLFQIR